MYKYTAENESQSRALAKVITENHQFCTAKKAIPGLGLTASGICISLWPKFFWAQIGTDTQTTGYNKATTTTKFNVYLWCTEKPSNIHGLTLTHIIPGLL